MCALGDDRVGAVAPSLANAQILRGVDHLVRHVGVGQLEGVANFLVGDENMLLGLVVFQAGVPDELLGELEACVDLVDQGGYVVGYLAEHDVVYIVPHGEACVLTIFFNLTDDRF